MFSRGGLTKLVLECKSVHELVELRRLRKQREGIDATKLIAGDTKKRRKRGPDEGEPGVTYGLKPGVRPPEEDEECVLRL